MRGGAAKGYLNQKRMRKMKLTGMFLLIVGVASFAFASTTVPEINAGSAGSALALLSGALLVVRGRKK